MIVSTFIAKVKKLELSCYNKCVRVTSMSEKNENLVTVIAVIIAIIVGVILQIVYKLPIIVSVVVGIIRRLSRIYCLYHSIYNTQKKEQVA